MLTVTLYSLLYLAVMCNVTNSDYCPSPFSVLIWENGGIFFITTHEAEDTVFIPEILKLGLIWVELTGNIEKAWRVEISSNRDGSRSLVIGIWNTQAQSLAQLQSRSKCRSFCLWQRDTVRTLVCQGQGQDFSIMWVYKISSASIGYNLTLRTTMGPNGSLSFSLAMVRWY